jgi:hypothetical protein
MGLIGEAIQKGGDLLSRGRLELEDRLDVDIGKAEPREASAERFADVPGRSAAHFQERSKDRFVIGGGEFVGGEALEKLGAGFLIEAWSAERGQQQSLDFTGG